MALVSPKYGEGLAASLIGPVPAPVDRARRRARSEAPSHRSCCRSSSEDVEPRPSSELSMADQQVVEYCFSAEPAWACDAIECTKAGVEFNFEKLCLLCKSGQLPEKITIYLEAATADAGGGGVQISKANEMKGAKVNGSSDGAPSASTAPANETFLEKEIRIAKDRDEKLRQEKLQRGESKAGVRQPTTESRRDSQDSGSATSRPSSASKAAAGATTTLRAAAVASASPPSVGGGGGALVSATVTASPKLFKSSEFTRSPNYKYEDPVQQDVRIALLREEEMRQQRAAGASPKQQPAPATAAAATTPSLRTEARVDSPAASKPAIGAANGTAPEKGSSPSPGRDIVIVESPLSSATAKETKGQLFGLPVAPATPAVSKIEAEIREQLAREAEYKRSTAN